MQPVLAGLRLVVFGLIYVVFSALYYLTRNSLRWRAGVRRCLALYFLLATAFYLVLRLNIAPFLFPISMEKLITTALVTLTIFCVAYLLSLKLYQDTFIAIKDTAKVQMMPAKPPPLPPSILAEQADTPLESVAEPEEKVRIATIGIHKAISHEAMAKHLTPELRQLLNIRV